MKLLVCLIDKLKFVELFKGALPYIAFCRVVQTTKKGLLHNSKNLRLNSSGRLSIAPGRLISAPTSAGRRLFHKFWACCLHLQHALNCFTNPCQIGGMFCYIIPRIPWDCSSATSRNPGTYRPGSFPPASPAPLRSWQDLRSRWRCRRGGGLRSCRAAPPG